MKVPTVDLTQLSNAGNPWPVHNRATQKVDCNVVKSIEAIYNFNGRKLSVVQARQDAHTLSGPTGVAFTRTLFTSEGLVEGTDWFAAGQGKPTQDLKDHLHAGHYVGLFVDYGTLNKGALPSGDPRFTGIHCIGLWGWRRSGTGQGILVWDHDPLFDGRRGAIPLGRQHVLLNDLLACAEDYAGVGYWKGWAVKIPL